jgi:hypothetical protein
MYQILEHWILHSLLEILSSIGIELVRGKPLLQDLSRGIKKMSRITENGIRYISLSRPDSFQIFHSGTLAHIFLYLIGREKVFWYWRTRSGKRWR